MSQSLVGVPEETISSLLDFILELTESLSQVGSACTKASAIRKIHMCFFLIYLYKMKSSSIDIDDLLNEMDDILGTQSKP